MPCIRHPRHHLAAVRAGLLVATLCVLSCAGMAAAGVARADTGDYAVDIPATEGYPGWWVEGKSTGPFNIRQARITTGIGSYRKGAMHWWRINVPDPSVRIVGGHIVGHRAVPNAAFAATVREGTDGGAIRYLVNDHGTGPFSVNLVGDMSFLDFGLQATSATSNGTADGNSIFFTSLTVALHDAAAPALAITAAPPGDRWFGTGCVTVALSAADNGSGIGATSIVNESSGAVAGDWGEAQGAGFRRGPTATSHEACVEGARGVTGRNSLRVNARDSAGQATSATTSVLFDLQQPHLALLDARDTVDVAQPAFSFEASDAHSGLASVDATVDGAAVQLASDRGRYSLRAPHLAVGDHVLVVTSVDQVGNASSARVPFHVRDVTPPDVQIASPGGSGGPAPRVVATATDDGSAVDALSWRVTVNGLPVPVAGTTDGLDTLVGMLSGGTHAIEVSVSDAAGNRATRRFAYDVQGLAARAGGLSIGATAGVFVTTMPTTAVAYGSPMQVGAVASSAGRPLAAHRLRLLEGDLELDSALTDAHGVAELSAIARHPMQLAIAAEGSDVPPAMLSVVVAPRITLRASTARPRRGRAVTLTGVVQPGRVVARVALEARIGGAWFPVRRLVRVRADGRFTTTVTASTRGTIAVRVRSLRAGGWAGALSTVRVLRVR